jgi:hypothetical protein
MISFLSTILSRQMLSNNSRTSSPKKGAVYAIPASREGLIEKRNLLLRKKIMLSRRLFSNLRGKATIQAINRMASAPGP